MYSTQNNKSSTLNISLNRSKDVKIDPNNMSSYNLQQSEIEKQQRLFHMMGSATPAYGGHPSATHFLASLLQNPTVLQNPELMASVAGMLQSSLNPHIVGGTMNIPTTGSSPVAEQMPQTGNCFRNFSIPTSDTSSQLQSIINSCHGGATSSIHAESCGDRSSHRSPSSTSSHHKYGRKSSDRFSASSHASSDNESNNSVDIGKFANSNELVINKVMTVIEEILANDNIRKNNFLAKLFEDQTSSAGDANKDQRPEILVKRIAGFKRVKAITTEFKVVQAAMGMSKMFDLGADGLSAFRVMPLPQLGSGEQQDQLNCTKNNNFKNNKEPNQPSVMHNKLESISVKDQQRVVKKVLAINFTSADFNIEKVTNTFEKMGEIAQISLIRPSRKVPDFLSEYTQWVPDLGTKPCAVIDFENQEAAQNACREINLSNRLSNGIRCALLKPGARIKRTLYRKYNSDGSIATKTVSAESKTTINNSYQKTYSRSSMDSGINHNSPIDDDRLPLKKQQSDFNRKNVKKAISKHFISLGAWKNSSDQPNGVAEGNYVISNISGFVRQPKGPVGQGFGLRRTVLI